MRYADSNPIQIRNNSNSIKGFSEQCPKCNEKLENDVFV
jgi:hypothetical protein